MKKSAVWRCHKETGTADIVKAIDRASKRISVAMLAAGSIKNDDDGAWRVTHNLVKEAVQVARQII